MSSAVPAAGLWAMLAAASLVLGAVAAERLPVSRAGVGRTAGFGAGSLLAALAYELVPGTRVTDALVWLGFAAGALLFYGLDALVERRVDRAGGPGGAGLSIAIGALLDGLPESVVLGLGVVVDGGVSVGFLVAVFVSNIPESLSATAELRATRTRGWIYGLWTAIVVGCGLAAAGGALVAEHVAGVDGRYLQALAAGAVLTMLASSLMPDAFEWGGRPVALFTALGFATAAILTTLD